jgi:hypothetical protein
MDIDNLPIIDIDYHADTYNWKKSVVPWLQPTGHTGSADIVHEHHLVKRLPDVRHQVIHTWIRLAFG